MAANGRCIGIPGESGAGKGTHIKNLLSKYKKNRKILSTVNDYDANAKVYTDFKTFIVDCVNVRDHILIFDESQVYLPRNFEDVRRKFPELLKILANARKFNNLILFVMHGFNQMPAWLPTYLNGIERFFTRENLRVQAVRFFSFPMIIKSFEDKPVLELHEHTYIHIR